MSEAVDRTVSRAWSGPTDAGTLEVARVLGAGDGADADGGDVAGWVAVASPVPNGRVLVVRR